MRLKHLKSICNDKNDLNFNISTTLSLENYDIVSKVSHSSRTFQQSLELARISLKYLIQKNLFDTIIQYSIIIALLN
jgi:hypothetical protein